MQQHLELSLDLIDESSENPRHTFSTKKLDELAASIRRHGVRVPIRVRPRGERFVVVYGERRVRASRLAEKSTIPALVEQLDDDAAKDVAIVENLHREDLTPLDQAYNYQELLAYGQSLDDAAALYGKPKAEIYRILSLTKLVPAVADLLARDVLPLSYALKLATVPPDRQADGLECCFSPLFREDGGEPFRRELLQPMVVLTNWIKKTVRLNPHSRDTQLLLPALAEQVAAAEEERRAAILTVSDLTFHADRTEPLPILRQSWKEADGEEDRCKYARPAVIVLGKRKDLFLHVCIDKARCATHWPKSHVINTKNGGATRTRERSAEDGEAIRQREARQQERELWLETLRARALLVLADLAHKLPLSLPLVRLVVACMQVDEADLEPLVGPLATLPSARWPQALALAVAVQSSWNRADFLRVVEELGIPIAENDLKPESSPTAQADGGVPLTNGQHSPRGKQKKKRVT